MTAPKPTFTISVQYPKPGTDELATSHVISTFGSHQFQLNTPDFSQLGNPEIVCVDDEATGNYDIKLVLHKKEPAFKIALEYPQTGVQTTGKAELVGAGIHTAMLPPSTDFSGLDNPSVEINRDAAGDFNIKFILKNRI